MPVPTTFPVVAADITPDWLTQALRAGGRLAEADSVVDVGLAELSGGFGQTSDTTRLVFDLVDAAGVRSTTTAIGKFATTNERRREASAASQLYAHEVAFYRDILPRISVRAPSCWFAEIDDSGKTFALLLEDFADHRPGDETIGCSPADARLAIEQMARLHAPFWGRAAESGAPASLESPAQTVRAAWDVLVDQFGDLLPDDVAAIKEEYIASLPALNDWVSSGTTTLVHGDFRLDNLLFGEPGSDDPVVLLDWQNLRTARGMQDFAYLVTHSMSTPDRRAHEDELIEFYVDTLASLGADYDLTQARADYRTAMLYLFVYVVYITGVNINTHERAIRRKRALVQRACQSLLDHDVLDLLPFSAPA
jgi:thiamine kinase-like enzyme